MGTTGIAAIIDNTLNDIFDRLDGLDRDEIDLEMSDGKLVIEFTDGIKYIVNRQSAADQIWLAEPRGGWHYDYRDGRWIDDKRGVELIGSIEALMSDKLGETITL
jgi:CyaY protein